MKKKPVECHSLVLTDIEGMSVKFGYTSGLFTVFSHEDKTVNYYNHVVFLWSVILILSK